jgi:hypothetical protein
VATVLPLLLLVPERLREPVARAQFHRLGARPGVGRAQAVVLQVAVAMAVDEDGAFAAAAFGDQDAGARQGGRVVLHELHVAQRHAVAEGQRHAVAGDDAGVGVLPVHPAGAAGGQDDGAAAERTMAPLAISMASTPQTRPSSTSRSATKNSS